MHGVALGLVRAVRKGRVFALLAAGGALDGGEVAEKEVGSAAQLGGVGDGSGAGFELLDEGEAGCKGVGEEGAVGGGDLVLLVAGGALRDFGAQATSR